MNLARLRELLKAATPGEWEAQIARDPYPNWWLIFIYSDHSDPPLIVQVLRGDSIYGLHSRPEGPNGTSDRSRHAEVNAKLISELRNSAESLITGCEERDRLREQMNYANYAEILAQKESENASLKARLEKAEKVVEAAKQAKVKHDTADDRCCAGCRLFAALAAYDRSAKP